MFIEMPHPRNTESQGELSSARTARTVYGFRRIIFLTKTSTKKCWNRKKKDHRLSLSAGCGRNRGLPRKDPVSKRAPADRLHVSATNTNLEASEANVCRPDWFLKGSTHPDGDPCLEMSMYQPLPQNSVHICMHKWAAHMNTYCSWLDWALHQANVPAWL